MIYLMGARDIESQIVVTTFTVGLAGVVFAFVFFSRVSGPFLALTVSLLLMTDYLLFTQWQVVTYRVWYGLFIFSSLLCAQGIGSQRRLLWAVLTFLNHMCLFYGELVFACFTAVMTGLYTAWAHRRNRKTVALGWGVQVAGAAIGLCIVATQVILYLGWDDFLQDLYLTFMARNYASNVPDLLQNLTEFYDTHNIMFWYNLRSADTYEGLVNLLHSIFSFSFLVHTPFLTLIVFLVFTGWLAGAAASSTSHLRMFSSLDPDNEVKALVACAFPVAVGLFMLLFKFVIEDLRLAGGMSSSLTMPLNRLVLLSMLSLPLAGYLTTVFVRQAWNAFPVDGYSPSAKVLVAGLYLCGAGSFASLQSMLYKQEWRIIWADTLGPSHQWIALTVACLAVVFGLLLIVLTPDRVLYRGGAEVKGTLPFLITGLMAFLVVYKLVPGYVHSGYLERYAPLVVFHVDSLFATSLFILLSAGSTAYSKLRAACSLQQAALAKAWGKQPALLLVASVGLAGYFLVYWVWLQVGFVKLFPYDSFVFMKMFRQAPYRGSSFVVNNDATPIFTFTGQWAYYDAEIGKGELTLTPGGFTVRRNLHTLWLADRNRRLDYLKPDYFLCFESRSVHSVTERLSSGGLRISGCGEVGIVKQASLNTTTILRHRLVDRDDSLDNSWAVVKLDWDFPPFLEPLTSENGGTAVQLKVMKTSAGWVADVNYRYRHQEGLPEEETQVRLFSVEPKPLGTTRSEAARKRRLIAEGIRQRRFLLPRQFEGFLQATVSPATATKIGPQYVSKLTWISVQENPSGQGSFH
ncbi:hypothetical protein AUG19_03475 [archaeon 13_1_20CM_2_54_9]|nr:MAG: hypothetical protein AUG19_03475 [archaeon 13_1_20CM_2_54_9]